MRAYSPADYSPSRLKDTKPTPVSVQPPVTTAGKKITSMLALVLLVRISTTTSHNAHTHACTLFV